MRVAPAHGSGGIASLNALLIASAIHLVTIPLWGALSDRVGRKPVYLFRRGRHRHLVVRAVRPPGD
jgi:MFS family permease